MSIVSATARPLRRSAGIAAQVFVIAFCLLAALVYRASVSLMPPGVAEDLFVSGVAAFLLVVALLMKRATAFSAYWEIPFAFFVFYVAGLLGDGNISPLQRWFVSDVLHESTSGGNPLASTVTGTVLAQLFGTVLIAIPIVGLTIASRRNLAEIFIAKPSNRWPIVVGVVCFVLIGFLALRGRTVAFFPIHGDFTTSRFVALAPALIVLVLLNGFREELFFRALFLKKYGRLMRPVVANVVAAVIFTSFHVEVKYAASVVIFLVYTLADGLILGWLMQRSGSLIASTLFHAGTDIPIFLVYLSFASG